MAPNKENKELAEVYAKAAGELEGQMCYVCDWCDEDLPWENKEGNAMDELVQEMLHEHLSVPPSLEYICKPSKEELIWLDTSPPVVKQSLLVFSDSQGFCKGILDEAPDDRVAQKKIVDKPVTSLTQDDVLEVVGTKGWDIVIYGFGLDPPRSSGVRDVLEHQTAVTKVLFFILKALIKNEGAFKKLVVITRGCFSDDSELNSDVGLGLIGASTLFGLCNSARIELNIPIHYIDTEYNLQPPLWLRGGPYGPTASIIPQLSSEVFREPFLGHNSVRILTSGRFVLRQVTSKAYEEAHCEFRLPSAGIIAFSGGNGALAMVIGEWLLDLAEQQGVSGISIKFLSRSAKLGDDQLPTWSKILAKAARLNISVEQARCDVGDPVAVDQFVRQIAPDLRGFIHAAGVLRDSMLPNLTWEKFHDVFNPKSRAAIYLHEAFNRHKADNLEFFWMFSSTSVYGNMGQINYSASNAFLDALARHRRALGKPGMAIQWGAWGEVGMASKLDAAMKRRFENSPQPPFLNREGLAGLEAGLRTGLPLVTVCKWNPAVMFSTVAASDSITAHYMRNWTSLIAPTPPAPTAEREHLYSMYRLLRTFPQPDPMNPDAGAYRKRLVYNHFIPPCLLNSNDDEDLFDEFRR